MRAFLFGPDTLKALAAILILIAAVYGFVSERIPPDLVSSLAILALLVTGILSPIEAFSGTPVIRPRFQFVALVTAAHMGINPMTLLVAVTFGASAAFAMPIGYQTSLMILRARRLSSQRFRQDGFGFGSSIGVHCLALDPTFLAFPELANQV